MKAVLAWLFSNLPVFIAVFILLGASVLSSGCYTLKQGTIMLGYLSRAVPLEELGKGAEQSGADRLFAKRAGDIRRFAMEELGLEESKNYTRYVELDRDYLAAVVSASAKDSFSRYQWWFPVVGRVPYKGFFNVKDARKERVKLEKKDLDVWVRGVDAFSTLGWFRDPLYSYMKEYSDQYLAELIIHELLHATVYINNHSQFNEGLAEFVGIEGGRLYMEKIRSIENENTQSVVEAQSVENKNIQADRAVYLTFIRGLIDELDGLYKSVMPREEKLSRKEEIINSAKASFDENYDGLFLTGNYRFFSGLPVNNAYLELFRLYHEEDHYFEDLYERSGRDLLKFINAAKTLGSRFKQGQGSRRLDKGNWDPREELEKALGLR